MKGFLPVVALALTAGLAGAQTVEFSRDVRPILSDKCFTCHGPSDANRKAKLRFDMESGAKQDLGGRFAIIPGDVTRSEIIRRVSSDNPAVRMPPAYTGAPKLNDREIGALTRWIEQGAKWQGHWAFERPQRPALPEVRDQAWPRNELDRFVLARLEREGLHPSPEAAREALIRRVTLDLTGLPPTLAEIDAFVKDTSPDAYEKVVDRLLQSPRYGERMSFRWLDAARYADTNGYQTDAERYMWRWRDWVIEAFNRNMRFDQFTIEQLAGDLLPNPTLDQRIATGFNRNHRGNGEGGIIPEEYAAEYPADRTEATSTVWMGLTVGCARCHDHKYDPIRQRDFYQIYAYFNNIPDRGRYNKYGNTVPMVAAPTREQQARLTELENKAADAERRFSSLEAAAARAQTAWETSRDRTPEPGWSLSRDVLEYFGFEGDGNAEGRVGRSQELDGTRFVNAGNKADFGFYEKFTASAWIYPAAPTGAIVTRTQEAPESQGWGVWLQDGKVQLNLVARWLDDALRVETEQPMELNRWHHVIATYDGSREASGIRIYVDGEPQKLKALLDELNQPFRSAQPLRIGGGGGASYRFKGRIDEVRIYSSVVTEPEARILAEPAAITEIATMPASQRTAAQAAKLRLFFLENRAPAEIRKAWQERVAALRERDEFRERIPTVMVMEEMPQPRETHILLRGAYDRPGDKVTPGVPAFLPPLPADVPNNRLTFAKWLVDPAHPLTARVAVNRFWQMYFGAGLVRTVEDFGSQGDRPVQPELLDWLATEFSSNWDIKALQKKIVMSMTYRQASRLRPELAERDPENRLFARGPRVRLAAEVVRDQALAMSGLLVEKLGGPSVKPYQPAGLWKELSGGEDYVPDHGENLYRRSLYTFWKRAAPPPFMANFDAAGRETHVVRETRTNTPLQALNLMNDVTYLEASRKIGERMMKEGGATPESRLEFAFRLATARRPKDSELQVLKRALARHRDQYQTNRQAALEFLNQGESPRDAALDVAELASYSAVASLILNLDEVVTKE